MKFWFVPDSKLYRKEMFLVSGSDSGIGQGAFSLEIYIVVCYGIISPSRAHISHPKRERNT